MILEADRELERVIIEGEEFSLPKIAVQVLENQKNELDRLRKCLEEANKDSARFAMTINNLVIGFETGKPMNFLDEIVSKAQWEQKMTERSMQIRMGLFGWIHDHWHQICVCKCDCGKLVSWDVLKKTNELKCNECASKDTF